MAVNPYAAPAADEVADATETGETEAIPRGALWLARAHVGLVALGLAFGGIAALGMRLALWRPEGSADPQAYSRMFSAHGSTMIFAVMLPSVFGVLGNLVVPEAVRARRAPLAVAGWAGLALWVTGTVVLVIVTMTSHAWTFFQPEPPRSLVVVPMLLAGATLLMLVQLAAMALAHWRTTTFAGGIVVAAMLVPLAGQCARYVELAVLQLRDPMTAAVAPLSDALAGSVSAHLIATLAALTHIAMRGTGSPMAVRTAALALAGVSCWLVLAANAVVALVGIGAKLTLVVIWIRAVGRTASWRGPVALMVACGIAPALLVYSVTVSLLARLSTDIHLHDTYFVIGQLHLAAAVIVATMLAGLLTWSVPLFAREPRPWPARIGAVAIGAGVLAHSLAMLQLGQSGMPRRYASYVPQFTDLHRATSIAAFAIAAGGVLLVLAWIAGRRSASAGGRPALLG